MNISLICATSSNNVIGVDNKIPWHLPSDLKRFKELTTGNCVIMGRKTYESIIESTGKILPDRENIVMSRQSGFEAPGCEVANSFEQALEKAKKLSKPDQKIFVIGGAEILYFNTSFDLKLPPFRTLESLGLRGFVLESTSVKQTKRAPFIN